MQKIYIRTKDTIDYDTIRDNEKWFNRNKRIASKLGILEGVSNDEECVYFDIIGPRNKVALYYVLGFGKPDRFKSLKKRISGMYS